MQLQKLFLPILFFACMVGKGQQLQINPDNQLVTVFDTQNELVLELHKDNTMIIYDTLAAIKALINVNKIQWASAKKQNEWWEEQESAWWRKEDKMDEAVKMVVDKYISQLPECVENAAIREYFQIIRK